jgi:hypothetical protein
MKISLYFVFYVALVLELLIFIVEKENALDDQRRVIEELATIVNRPLVLPDTSFPAMRGEKWLELPVVGLLSEAESLTVEYSAVSLDSGVVMSAIARRPNGNLGLLVRFPSWGEYRFRVKGAVKRNLPNLDSLSQRAREMIRPLLDSARLDQVIHFVAGDTASSRKVTLVADLVTQGGTIKWPEQVPLELRLTIVNADARAVVNAAPFYVVSRDPASQLWNLKWDNPTTSEVSLTVNAGRGAASLDFARLDFGVETQPLVWEPRPDEEVSWGVPTSFISQLTTEQLYYVEAYPRLNAGGEGRRVTISRGKEYQYTPESTWSHMVFEPKLRALNRVLPRKVEQRVVPPPPPSITVEKSSWKDDKFRVVFVVKGYATESPRVTITPSGSGLRFTRLDSDEGGLQLTSMASKKLDSAGGTRHTAEVQKVEGFKASTSYRVMISIVGVTGGDRAEIIVSKPH